MTKIYLRILLLATILPIALTATAQKNYFRSIAESAIRYTEKDRVVTPQKYAVFSLDNASMKSFLGSLPKEIPGMNRNQTPVLALPMPDGSVATFHVWESSIQEPGLEARFPEIKTFVGQGISDPYATIRFDYTLRGFHAQVLTVNGKGGYYIDPFSLSNTQDYMSYFRTDLRGGEAWLCDVVDDINANPSIGGTGAKITAACLGPSLRTYRLAVACTGEYAQAPGVAAGTNPALLHSAIVTTINRVVGVYEKEVAVRLVLIANNATVEYLDASTDPFNGNNNANTLINESQVVIDANIGTANYDIGHTFSTGGGGLAQLNSPCGSSKARGITGSSSPTGDAYDIDYVAHEMGHQFGGNHSMAGCGSSPNSTKYETGSGTTIQAYAGICGAENIQPNSDPNFHAISFDEISNFLVTGGGATCGVITPTGNNIPVIAPLTNNNLSIPVSTPFTLSGTATDPDGDALSYNWEQWDFQGAVSWNAGLTQPAGNTVPLFKSRIPKTTGVRTFPDMAVILANYPTNPPATMGGLKGETLSPVARDMKFKLTVRDNKAGGGGVASSGAGGCQTSTVFVVSTVGTTPFAVTVPNGGETYAGGSTQTITWNNAGSNIAPINVANVRITLSTDGGLTYPTVIAASTANDGSESLTIPAVATTSTARVRIEAIGNVFFDISNNNFTITAPLNAFEFVAPAPVTVPCATVTPVTSTIATNITGTFVTPIVLTYTSLPAGPLVTFTPNPLAPGASTVATVTNAATLPFGTYAITVTGTAGAVIKTTTLTLNVTAGAGPVFTVNPSNQTVCAPGSVTFTSLATGATSYQWQVSTAAVPAFTNISGATSAAYTIVTTTAAVNNNQYRVIATGQCGTTISPSATLTVNTAPVVTTQPTNQTVCAGTTATFTAAATGTALTYQWQVSTTGCTGVFTDITGATNATYTTPAVTAANNGYGYRVVVSGTCAPAATSNCAVLTVGDAAVITAQPLPATVCSPANASFSVTATGSSLTYQWQVSTDGGTTFTDVTGATSATYTFATTPALNGNRYRVRVFSCTPTGITSNAALLTVNTPVSISAQPANSTVCQGTSTSFSVTAAGTGVTYQWQYSATGCTGTFSNITGATSATYTIASPTPANNGGYRVVIGGTCGSVTSSCATLLVNTPIAITTQPQSQGVCIPTVNSASFNVSVTGTAPTYQWQVSTNGGTSFTDITGATNASYVVTPLAVSQNGNQYRVIVKGTCTTAGVISAAATLTVNTVVAITQQPVSVATCTDQTATFTVLASGSTITYQWQVSVNGGPFTNLANNANYSGVNTATLTVSNLSTALSGNTYRVIVSGVPCGSVTSSAVNLTVNAKPTVILTTASYPNITPYIRTGLFTTISPVAPYSFQWYKNNTLLPSVTSSNLPITVDDFGEYYVVATNVNTGCSGTSNRVTVMDSVSNTLFIYPNPNKGAFQVRYYNQGGASVDRTINVYDERGARVFTKKYSLTGVYGRMDVVLDRITASGTYFVDLRDASGKRLANGKVVVKQ